MHGTGDFPMYIFNFRPEDTPYTGGCYQFDIYFPVKYPHSAPMVNFRTTGGGIVRFNPNLYQCGKVCLSLLGTWEGAQGEQWNETSTLLQASDFPLIIIWATVGCVALSTACASADG